MMRLAEYRSHATGLADFLPWAALVADGVILNKDGSLQRSARFRGPDLDSATASELVGVSARLNNALRRLGSGWAVFVEAQRNMANAYPPCDAGIRYDERLEQDMIAVPIGPRVQRFATAAAPAYLAQYGRPTHPRDLLDHSCILGRFGSGLLTTPWEFEHGGEVVRVDPTARLIVSVGGAMDLGVDAAVVGLGVIHLFEDWLRPYLSSGALEPMLEEWWQPFSGPFLYHPSRRLVPPPLRAFIDYIRAS